MIWIGLTGGIASGKSTVAKIFGDLGVPVLDADQVAKQALDPGSPLLGQVRSFFGDEIFDAKGVLDRRKLGQIVFQDTSKRSRLEAWVHPWVQTEVAQKRAELKALGHQLAIYDVPLLYEKSLEKNFDAVIVVSAPEEQMRLRMRQRNQWSDAEISSRLSSQIPLAQKEKRADYLIRNDGDLKALREQTEKTLKALKTRFHL